MERGQIITADGTVIALSTPTGAEREPAIRAALPAGPAVRRHHGLLLADLRQDRAGAGHEQLPVGRRAGARGLDARRPGAGPAEEGRPRHHHDRRPICSRSPPTHSAPSPERSWRSIRAAATSSRWCRTPRSTRTSCRRRTRPQSGGVEAPERRSAHTAALPGERRALPAGVDVQDGHGLRGARERLRPGQHVAEPPRAGPAAHERDASRTSAANVPGRRDHDAPHRVHQLVQRDLRRGRTEARRAESWPTRRTRSGSARPTRRARPGASNRRSRS